MRIVALAIAAALFALTTSTAAFAGCTADDLQQKVQTFSTKFTALAQKDAQKAQEISAKVQSEAPQLKGLDDSCQKYDEWIALVTSRTQDLSGRSR